MSRIKVPRIRIDGTCLYCRERFGLEGRRAQLSKRKEVFCPHCRGWQPIGMWKDRPEPDTTGYRRRRF